MTNTTLAFYRWMLWMAEFELVIALSTGRSPAHIAEIRADEAKELAELRKEVAELRDELAAQKKGQE